MHHPPGCSVFFNIFRTGFKPGIMRETETILQYKSPNFEPKQQCVTEALKLPNLIWCLENRFCGKGGGGVTQIHLPHSYLLSDTGRQICVIRQNREALSDVRRHSARINAHWHTGTLCTLAEIWFWPNTTFHSPCHWLWKDQDLLITPKYRQTTLVLSGNWAPLKYS